jgi:hypothetical protein
MFANGLAALILGAQAQSVPIPQFEDYKVAEVFSGRPAVPKLIRPGDKMFRTMIRTGAAKGPNFAGHFTIAEWGCGSSCVSIAIVDAKTGDVRDGPFHILGFATWITGAGGDDQPLEYNLHSRLLKVRGCPEEQNCGQYFYEWNGSRSRLIRKIAATEVRR